MAESTIPAAALDLFEKPLLAHFATVMTDGTPQVTPVWVDFDGTHVLINTAKGRQKTLNVERHPKVGLDIVDAVDQYHWVSIRGTIDEVTEQGADAHIDKMSKKYTGNDKYNNQTGETRVIIKIRPDRVIVR